MRDPLRSEGGPGQVAQRSLALGEVIEPGRGQQHDLTATLTADLVGAIRLLDQLLDDAGKARAGLSARDDMVGHDASVPEAVRVQVRPRPAGSGPQTLSRP